MSDQTLRKLERAVAETPDDPALRLQWGAALERSGRLRDALEAYAVEPQFDLPVAERASAALWHAVLRDLSLEMRVPLPLRVQSTWVDASGVVVWAGAWDGRTGVGIASVGDGTVRVHLPEVHTNQVWPIDGGGVCMDHTTDELIRFRWVEGRAEVERRTLTTRRHLRGVSPDGSRVFVWHDGVGQVCRWSGLAVERTVQGYNLQVDWEVGCVVDGQAGSVVVHPLGGGEPWRLAASDASHHFELLGRGLLAQTGHVLQVFCLRARWSLRLIEGGGRVGLPVLARDARGLRVPLGQQVVRYEVDFAGGVLLRTPEGRAPEAVGRPELRGRSVIHPAADVVATHEPAEVRTVDHERLCSLPPEAEPLAWSRDGLRLLLHQPQPDGTARLEVWTPSV